MTTGPRPAEVEVLRIRRSLAFHVLAVLKERGIPCGPVLDNRARAALEVLVPDGTAATWPALPGTRCVAGAHLPSPARRAWIWPTDPSATVSTDPDALCEAVTVALAQLAAPLLGAVHPHPEMERS
ncbi:hypothetical protein [Streptomyces fractus]|uniref:hypothetical protein n=1 Tax=Streptomyces fractus TaxID=641806 RepID=UPI003CED5687